MDKQEVYEAFGIPAHMVIEESGRQQFDEFYKNRVVWVIGVDLANGPDMTSCRDGQGRIAFEKIKRCPK